MSAAKWWWGFLLSSTHTPLPKQRATKTLRLRRPDLLPPAPRAGEVAPSLLAR